MCVDVHAMDVHLYLFMRVSLKLMERNRGVRRKIFFRVKLLEWNRWEQSRTMAGPPYSVCIIRLATPVDEKLIQKLFINKIYPTCKWGWPLLPSQPNRYAVWCITIITECLYLFKFLSLSQCVMITFTGHGRFASFFVLSRVQSC